MIPRGKLIAVEGVDGSGKRTQCELLVQALRARGVACAPFSFPRYESTFGRMIAGFLNGKFGKLESVDAHFSALLYAGDRLEAKPELEAALAAGSTVVADRYVASNLAHQGARIPAAERAEFLSWLRHIEHGIYGLPAEDLVIYLRLAAREAQRRIGQKAAREYTAQKRDLQESDLQHLEHTAAVYDELARQPNWVTVECLGHGDTGPRSPAEIHKDVLAALESQIFRLDRA